MSMTVEEMETSWRALNIETDTWVVRDLDGSLVAYATLEEHDVGMTPEMRVATYEKELRAGEQPVVRAIREQCVAHVRRDVAGVSGDIDTGGRRGIRTPDPLRVKQTLCR